MQNLMNAFFNCLFVSIPEESIWTFFVLVSVGRLDLLDLKRWKRNIKWILIPVIPVSMLINIFKYIIVIPKPLMSISTLILLIILIDYIIKKTDRINETRFYKILLFTLLGAFLLAFIETLYYPVFLYLTNLKIADINLNVINNFLLSIPTRVVEIVILSYIIYSKTYKIKFLNLLKMFKNKFAIISIIINLVFIILFWILSLNVFANEGIFRNLSVNMKLLYGTSITILPTIFFVIIIYTNMYHYQKNIQIEQKMFKMLEEQ